MLGEVHPSTTQKEWDAIGTSLMVFNTTPAGGKARRRLGRAGENEQPGRSRGGERRLPPGRAIVDVDRRHPLDPPIASPVGSHQTNRAPIAIAQRRPGNVCRQEEQGSLGEREPPPISRHRAHDDALSLGRAEETIEPRPGPLLGGVPASGAVESRLDHVSGPWLVRLRNDQSPGSRSGGSPGRDAGPCR